MKNNHSSNTVSFLMTLSILLLTACGNNSDNPTVNDTVNSAPSASNVSIIDINASPAVVGDRLTGSYTFSDAEGDAEGEGEGPQRSENGTGGNHLPPDGRWRLTRVECRPLP